MRKYLIIFFAGIACASLHAAPGFLKAVLTGVDHESAIPVWSDSSNPTTLLSLSEMNQVNDSLVPQRTTVVYGAYMYMQGGVTYYFRGAFDDYVSVRVDEFDVVKKAPDGQWCSESRGSIRFAENGWHKLDLRVSNDGGEGGTTSSIINTWEYGGIQYSIDNATWNNFADLGDGTKFQTTNPEPEKTFTVEYRAEYNYSVAKGTSNATIRNKVEASGSADIPATIDGFTVVALSPKALQFNMTSLSFPATLTSIGDSAFNRFSNLTLIAVDDGNPMYKVVNGCLLTKASNTLIAVPGGLSSVTVPDGVLTLPGSMFYDCVNLRSVVLPSGMTTIGGSAFYNCSGLATVVIPDSVISIEGSAFRQCSNLKEIALPSHITTISSYCFYGCSALSSIDIPAWVGTIGEYAFYGCTSFINLEIPSNVKSIAGYAFANCSNLQSLILEEGVESFTGSRVFRSCSSLKYVSIPSTFKSFYGYYDFDYCDAISKVEYHGAPPANISAAQILGRGCQAYPREYGAKWQQLIGINNFNGYLSSAMPEATVVSSSIRENDPTIMDVVYKVKSSKSKVKVRVLAFEDGERSFAKVVRPETFIEGTEVNVGDNVTPNVEHTISWRVSSDWTTKLAKVKFEVLASEGDLLPLELMMIPASDQYGKMKISWNAISDAQLFDALLWLTASKDSALSFSSGVLRANGTNVAQNTGFDNDTQREAAASFIFGKMGYQRMTGAILNYANQETRLGLSPSGSRQYAYKMVP